MQTAAHPAPRPSPRQFRASYFDHGSHSGSSAAPGAEAATWHRLTSPSALAEEPDQLCPLNPPGGRLPGYCGRERRFVQGFGAWLRDDRGRRFLDCHGQMGELLLGHNAPAIRSALEQALHDGLPALMQSGRAAYAGELAQELARCTGMPHCLFTTTGAEAIDAALRLVRARTRRPLILMAVDGRSLRAAGADPVTSGIMLVPHGDRDALAAQLQRESGRTAAVLIAPVGKDDGGAEPESGYLAAARELCNTHGARLILDETGLGMGRTGRLLAAEHEGVQADLIALGQGLGGGLFPLRALLGRTELWDDALAHCRQLPLGPNNLACRVGLAVLHELQAAELWRDAAVQGVYLRRQLEGLRLRFPAVVAAVYGRGLHHAVELRCSREERGMFFAYASRQGLLSYLAAAAAAERSSVLFLPSPGEAGTLRLLPPLAISSEELDLAIHALTDVCQLLAADDSAAVVRAIGATHPLPLQPATLRKPPMRLQQQVAPAPPTRSTSTFAYLAPYDVAADVVHNDPSLAALSEQELGAFIGFAAALPAGIVARKTVRSAACAEADCIVFGLPVLPTQLPRLGRARMNAVIAGAVARAAQLGAQVVGLGGFTGRYAHNGRAVVGRGPAITTGHTLTAVMAVRAVEFLRGADWHSARVAVIGVSSAVGRLCARLIGRQQPAHLRLVGASTRETASLRALAAELGQSGGEHVVIGSTTELAADDVVFSAVGARRPTLDTAPLAPGTIVCDLGRPQDAPWHVRARGDLTVIDGGAVALPDRSLRFGVGNLHGLPAGVQVPSLAETMLLALAGVLGDTGVGDQIPLATADRIEALAHTHGFSLAAPLCEGQLLREPDRKGHQSQPQTQPQSQHPTDQASVKKMSRT